MQQQIPMMIQQQFTNKANNGNSNSNENHPNNYGIPNIKHKI